MKKYNHKAVEKKWQSVWNKKKVYATKDTSEKPKKYILDMFPYPSGEGLHVGHPKGYIATDIYSRMKRMQGYNVLHPMGFDAFGLPAENYAIKHKVHPEKSTAKNVVHYKEQLKSIGLDYDWSREINTTDPKYYKWTQWIFLKLFEKGLAYESFEPINWCPSCQTGLANEDLEDGKCERCGSVVEKKPMRQWMLRITDYAERLLAELDALDWPESIKESQRNWIGKSEGMLFSAPVKDTDITLQTFSAHFEAFAADTFVVIAPDHALLPKLLEGISNKKEILDFAATLVKKRTVQGFVEEKESEGIFTGRYIVDPVGNGDLPIWVASFALADYGTGIVKCSAHDERDFSFAKKYNIPLKEVLEPIFTKKDGTDAYRPDEVPVPRNVVVCIVKHWSENKYLCLEWKKNDWRGFVMGGIEPGEKPEVSGAREIHEETGYKNARFVRKIGGTVHSRFYHELKKVNRFAHFESLYFELENGDCDDVSEEEKAIHNIVWLSPEKVEEFTKRDPDILCIWKRFYDTPTAWTDMKNSVLNEPKEFAGKVAGEERQNIIAYLERNKLATRKTTYKLKDWVFSRQRYWGEPMPLLHTADGKVIPLSEKDLPLILPKVKSYAPTGTGESPLADIKKWVETTIKIGKEKVNVKRETNTMPQWAGSSWYYLRYMDPKNDKALVDPQKEKYWGQVDMYVGGTEHATRHLIYARFWHKFLYDIGAVSTTEPFAKLKNQGLIIGEDGRKMSKRWGNIVNPDDVIATYGADTLRLYEMFMGPFEASASWSTNSMIGSRRFIERVWRLAERVDKKMEVKKPVAQIIQKTLKKVTEDIEEFRFNTAISSLMICLNTLEEEEKIPLGEFQIFLKMLSPFTPHVAENLWNASGGKGLIVTSEWPKVDETLLVSESARIGVQVNGKVRADIEVGINEDEETVKKRALALPEVQKWLDSKPPKKIIYVKGKIVSIVL